MLRNRKQLQKYVNQIRKMFGLSEWEIEVRNERPEEEWAAADVFCVRGRRCGVFRVSDSFFVQTAEEQRHIVLHELLHCHHAHPDTLVSEHIGTKVGESWNLAMEYTIDHLASALAPRFPLPE